MKYKESLTANIKYSGKWNASHLIKEPSWKDIYSLFISKLFKGNMSINHEQLRMENALQDEGERQGCRMDEHGHANDVCCLLW